MLFVAENLATLEYKLQEEVMTVVHQLSRVVSACTQLASVLETASPDGAPDETIESIEIASSEVSADFSSLTER